MTEKQQTWTVLEWGRIEGGMLGALIVCVECEGMSRDVSDAGYRPCSMCDGDGELHQPYYLPNGEPIDLDRHAEILIQVEPRPEAPRAAMSEGRSILDEEGNVVGVEIGGGRSHPVCSRCGGAWPCAYQCEDTGMTPGEVAAEQLTFAPAPRRSLRGWSQVTLANSRRWFPPPDSDHQRLMGKSSGRSWEIEHQALGLSGEMGEIVEHVKKWHRGDFDVEELARRLEGEVPDALTYLLNLAELLRFDLDALLAAKQDECEKRWGSGGWGRSG